MRYWEAGPGHRHSIIRLTLKPHKPATLTCQQNLHLPNFHPSPIFCQLPTLLSEAEIGGPSWAQFSSKQQVSTPPTCIPWLSRPDYPHSYTSPTKLRPQDGPGAAAQGAGMGGPDGGVLSVGDEGKRWRLHLLPFPPSPPPPPLPLLPSPALGSSSVLSQSQAVRPGWLAVRIQAPS